mmetsp:Transcript_41259/g.62820  ORF Transcript_41259/g.62820 Transcript_41259/m.62820 type:complete len:204 (+) Transcript_41259:161-772(+)
MDSSFSNAIIEKAVMASLFDNNRTIEMLMAGEAEAQPQQAPNAVKAKSHDNSRGSGENSAKDSVVIQGKEWQDISADREGIQDTPQQSQAQKEPLPASERERDREAPCGLKNVGNTCYFASLMQTLFALPNLQEKILNFDLDEHKDLLKNLEKSDISPVEKVKLTKSRELVKALQELLTRMLTSRVKYQNPNEVLSAIVDDRG